VSGPRQSESESGPSSSGESESGPRAGPQAQSESESEWTRTSGRGRARQEERREDVQVDPGPGPARLSPRASAGPARAAPSRPRLPRLARRCVAGSSMKEISISVRSTEDSEEAFEIMVLTARKVRHCAETVHSNPDPCVPRGPGPQVNTCFLHQSLKNRYFRFD
jgi:hypothetical protein